MLCHDVRHFPGRPSPQVSDFPDGISIAFLRFQVAGSGSSLRRLANWRGLQTAHDLAGLAGSTFALAWRSKYSSVLPTAVYGTNRAKMIDENVLPHLLDDIVNHLRGSGLAVVLNDYVECVKITGADGVHLGYEDYPIFEARALLGQKAIIGATVRNYGEALHASGQGASYLGAGSVYESPTKGGLPVIGVEGITEIKDHLNEEAMPRPGWGRFDHVPICAIGGITKERLSEVYEAGASIAAMIGAIQDQDDPVKAARELVVEWGRFEDTD